MFVRLNEKRAIAIAQKTVLKLYGDEFCDYFSVCCDDGNLFTVYFEPNDTCLCDLVGPIVIIKKSNGKVLNCFIREIKHFE